LGGGIGTLIGVIEHPSVAPRLAQQLYKASKGAMTMKEATATVKQRLGRLRDERGLVGKDIDSKTIYHGTDKIFDDFDVKKSADGTIWFTDSKAAINKGQVAASGKGVIVERLIKEKELKLGGWEESDKYSTDELISMGYDGLKLKDGGETTYQIFHPEKLVKKNR
jgi:hypothetical protein